MAHEDGQGGPAAWDVLARREYGRNRWRVFVQERVRTHTGEVLEDFSFLEAIDAVYVVPLTTDGHILMIRQYRHPIRAWIQELPAGGVYGDATPEAIAREEMQQEVGGAGGVLNFVATFWSNTGNMRQLSHLYFAHGVQRDAHDHEATEWLEVLDIPAAEALRRARAGEIEDGQSALALLLCESRITAALATLAGAGGLA